MIAKLYKHDSAVKLAAAQSPQKQAALLFLSHYVAQSAQSELATSCSV